MTRGWSREKSPIAHLCRAAELSKPRSTCADSGRGSSGRADGARVIFFWGGDSGRRTHTNALLGIRTRCQSPNANSGRIAHDDVSQPAHQTKGPAMQ